MKKKKFWLLVLLIFLMGSILFGAYYLTRAELLRQAKAELPKLYVFVWPQIGEVAVEDEFSVEVRVNSRGKTLRRLDYQLEFTDGVRVLSDSANLLAASWEGEVMETATLARLNFRALASGKASFSLRASASGFMVVTEGAEIIISK